MQIELYDIYVFLFLTQCYKVWFNFDEQCVVRVYRAVVGVSVFETMDDPIKSI
jgi:hypothetical protein